ncbi:MAG: tRNA (adenosine(37)-N6)-threonylcarbamoyltransferase complex ATPase subunit type 1 TsaE [Thiobacillus sp. 65-69]|nr:tRNA (adenosine(37)-N6)-threonylcarbamoyltransferase complex ATPase subunit type 1 TsaE [Thiobacillus sp.]ODU89866.1 MAG: tRNA (adenosine(37)-N6)-threonylcarbamoyltransferase complex ATPase subunit type 1 TsaE [Thiobacillus sp. SCN 65-179]OJW37790.1 MAG: tRNA (adenosine(37)-N6)-threonylcarbamoyltransferase complex ATPase subunit type 1 TsaE [Thiobacillus sp. 65-69]
MHGTDHTARCNCHLADEAATLDFGAQLGRELTPGLCLYLEGDLGAGKTTLVRGMLRALGHAGRVKSPTYTLAETYELPRFELYHFDLYRMHDPREWLDAGFRDIGGDAVSLIEWPEKAAGWLPEPDVILRLEIDEAGRTVDCRAVTPEGARFLEASCARS